MCLATALFVARPLTPSEDASSGSGLLFVTLWLVAGCLWALGLVFDRQFRLRLHWVDAAVAVFVLAEVVSAVFVASARRPALNMAWEWVGLALAYLLIRQLVVHRAQVYALAGVMTALAVSLSALGLFQVFWEHPQMVAEYERDWPRILREMGIDPDSPERVLFERRLENPEPIATFALSNSLAGFLLPWLLVGVGALTGRGDGGALRRNWPSLLLLMAVLACLVLTKSRTAYVGGGVGLVVLGVLRVREAARRRRESARTEDVPETADGRRRAMPTTLLFLAGLAVAVVVVVGWFGGLDRTVFAWASRSFEARLEYWTGAWGVIQERPLTGVGSGNFRQHYLRYKLPESSEEIADPHNLLIEAWATGGVAAIAGLLAALGLFLRSLLVGGEERTESATAAPSPWPVFAGGGGAWVVAALLPEISEGRLIGLAAVWSVGTIALWPMLRRGGIGGGGAVPAPTTTAGSGHKHRRDASAILLAAVVALVVHLLGQGGLAMPGVSQSLWLLLGLGLALCSTGGRDVSWRQPVLAWAVALVLVGAFGAFELTTRRPVAASRRHLAEANAAWRRGSQSVAVEHARRAAEADPLSATPWTWLAQARLAQWRTDSTDGAPALFDQAVQAARHAIARDPFRAEGYRLLGRIYHEHYRRTGDRTSAERAADAYVRSIERYPNNIIRLAEAAEASWDAGRDSAAARYARRALEIDRTTLHLEKRLSEGRRLRLEERLGE